MSHKLIKEDLEKQLKELNELVEFIKSVAGEDVSFTDDVLINLKKTISHFGLEEAIIASGIALERYYVGTSTSANPALGKVYGICYVREKRKTDPMIDNKNFAIKYMRDNGFVEMANDYLIRDLMNVLIQEDRDLIEVKRLIDISSSNEQLVDYFIEKGMTDKAERKVRENIEEHDL